MPLAFPYLVERQPPCLTETPDFLNLTVAVTEQTIFCPCAIAMRQTESQLDIVKRLPWNLEILTTDSLQTITLQTIIGTEPHNVHHIDAPIF